MDRKIFQLLIFHKDNLIYYNDFISKSPDYASLSASHRIQNCLGLSVSISALIKQIHPDRTTQFKNFRTREYQFNLFQCINNLKFILITSVRTDDDGIDGQLERIYRAYVDYVSRNYLYNGGIVESVRFQDEIGEILFPKNRGD